MHRERVTLALKASLVAVAFMATVALAQQRPVRSDPRTTPQRPAAERVVWRVSGDAAFGRVSADGRLIPFLSANDAAGRQLRGREVFVHDLNTGRDRRLTNSANTAENEGAPGDARCICVISGDATRIAYVWWTVVDGAPRPELRVVRLSDGGFPTPHKVFPGRVGTWLVPFGWTPDGEWIAATIHDNANGRTQIALLSTRDTTITVLKTLPPNRLGGTPALSPDGQAVAYDLRAERGREHDIMLLDRMSGQERVLVSDPRNDAVVAWAPDGMRVLFVSDRRGSRDLWTIDTRAGGDPAPRLVRRDIQPSTTLGLSASGAHFYLTQRPESPTIRIDSINFVAGDTISRTFDRVRRPMFWRALPTWSNDGKQLAYVAARYQEGRDLVLAIRTVDARTEREFKPPLWGIYDIRWSPDDRTIAVQGDGLIDSSGVYLIDAMTGVTTRLDGVESIRRWSPTGRRIYFDREVGSRGDTIAIIERELSTGAEREVYRGGAGGVRRLAFSPDVRTIYYRRTTPGSPLQDLIARNVDTGLETTLVAQRMLGALDISPDGRFVTVQSGAETLIVPVDSSPIGRVTGYERLDWAPSGAGALASVFELPGVPYQGAKHWWIQPSGAARRRVNLQVSLSTAGGFALSPDGHRIAFFEREQLTAPPSEIWVLENFLPPGLGDGAKHAVTVSVSTAQPMTLRQGFAGYNVALMSTGISYRSPQLAAAAAQLRSGWLRFPAGARSNAFDWRTGKSPQGWVEKFRGTAFFTNLQHAAAMLDAKEGEKIEDAAALATSIGARGLIVSVNTFTDTPQSAGEYAAWAKARRIPVLVWQLANEPSFFPSFFADARVYAEKMRPYADAIRAVDPTAHVSLSLGIVGVDSPRWDSTLAAVKPRYWDVLTYHHYPQLRGDPSELIASLNEVLATETAQRVQSHVRPLFGAMPVIITETAPGSGSARPEASMVGTLYGGIWAAEYALRLSAASQVWHIGMHQLMGPAGIDYTDDHRLDLIAPVDSAGATRAEAFDYGLFLSAQGAAYAVAAEGINAASAIYRTRTTGGGNVALRSAGEMPAVHAQAYRSRSGTTIVLTNKGSQPQRVTVLLDGEPVPHLLHAVTAAGTSPTLRNSAGTATVRERQFTAKGAVTIPAYSVTRISWP